MNSHLRFVYLLSLVIIGCAQVRSISGGEKDTAPPTLLTTQPANNCLRFPGNSFTLFFDEYIQLRDVQKELLVSPPLKSPPSVKVRQRSLEVSWNDSLRPSATYIFQFGNAIADLNESNVLSDISYVFSTGDILDSLQFAGKITDAMTDKPVATAKVLLFDSLTHVFSSNSRPAYFTRRNDKGLFRFKYLRAGSYTVCALSDENNNNHYDVGESIDWLENVSPALPSDTSFTQLYSSVPRDTAVRSFNYIIDNTGVVKFHYNTWLPTPSVRSLSTDSIVQWLVKDTLYAAVSGKCSGRSALEIRVGNKILDTLEVERVPGESATMKLNHAIPQKVTTANKLLIHSQRPISIVDNSRMECYCDSVSLACESLQVTDAACEVILNKKPGKSYRLVALPGWITDDCGATNDTLRHSLTVYDNKDLGSIRVVLPTEYLNKPHTFSLIDGTKKSVFEISRITSREWIINDLVPGEYVAIIGNDSNGNGIFDPCSIWPPVKTERNKVYLGNIQVRPNWEVVLEWPALPED